MLRHRMLTLCSQRLLFVLINSFIRIFLLIIITLSTIGCKPEKQTTSIESPEDQSLCQFTKGDCSARIDNISLSIHLSPENAPSEKPLTLDIYTDKPVNSILVRIEGRDMFMGVIPVQMRQIAENHFQGTLVYGSCSSGYMVWRAFVTLNNATHPITATFDFLADSE